MRAPQPTEHDTLIPLAPSQPGTETPDASTLRTGSRLHPRWCDRRRCQPGQDGARHASTPTRLVTGEQIFALSLIQHPEGEPELLIEVTDTGDPDGLQVLTLPETKKLAETLLIEYLHALAGFPATSPTHHGAPASTSPRRR